MMKDYKSHPLAKIEDVHREYEGLHATEVKVASFYGETTGAVQVRINFKETTE